MKERISTGKVSTALLLTAVLFTPYQAFSNNGKGAGSDKLPKGKPFAFLQDQIDMLAMDLATLDASINLRVEQLEAEVSDLEAVVMQNSADIDAIEQHQQVQDTLIATLQIGIGMLERKIQQNANDIDALEAWNRMQDSLLAAINRQLVVYEQRIAANENDIRAIIGADAAMQARINTLQTSVAFLTSQNSTQNSTLTSLQNQLTAAQSSLSRKQNRITGICSVGFSIRAIYANGTVSCERDDATANVTLSRASVSRQLSRTRFCASSVPVIGCTDYEYYSSGTAFCPSTYNRTGGGFDFGRSTDVLANDSRPNGNGWYVQTKEGDDETYSNFGYVSCVRVNVSSN